MAAYLHIHSHILFFSLTHSNILSLTHSNNVNEKSGDFFATLIIPSSTCTSIITPFYVAMLNIYTHLCVSWIRVDDDDDDDKRRRSRRKRKAKAKKKIFSSFFLCVLLLLLCIIERERKFFFFLLNDEFLFSFSVTKNNFFSFHLNYFFCFLNFFYFLSKKVLLDPSIKFMFIGFCTHVHPLERLLLMAEAKKKLCLHVQAQKKRENEGTVFFFIFYILASIIDDVA